MKKLNGAVLILFALLPIFSWAQSSDELPNFIKVEDGLYRGGEPSTAGLKILASQYNVKTDIDLQGGDLNNKSWQWWVKQFEPGELPDAIKAESQASVESGISFYPAALDSLDPVTDAEDALIDQVLAVMHDPSSRPVYIHCQHGKDRTGLLVALYKVKFEHVSPQEAYDEWTSLGHGWLSQRLTGNLDKYYWEKVKEFQVQTVLKEQ